MLSQMIDFPSKLVNLVTQGKLQAQLNPGDSQVVVLVLANDQQTILDCELRPFAELAAALAVQDSIPTTQGASSE